MKILLSILLIILSLLLSAIFYPIGWVYALWNKTDGRYLFLIAESIDQLGNHIMQHAFNKWLIYNNGYKFGNIDETISSVLGKNKKTGTLSKSGIWLDCVLNKLDKGHSIDAIEENP